MTATYPRRNPPAQVVPLAGRYDHEALVLRVLALRRAVTDLEAHERDLLALAADLRERAWYAGLAAALGGFLLGGAVR